MAFDYAYASEEEKKEYDKIINLHAFLANKADVDYMCFTNNIPEEDFWQIYLWTHHSINWKVFKEKWMHPISIEEYRRQRQQEEIDSLDILSKMILPPKHL